MDEFRLEYIEKSDLLVIISWNSWGIKRCPRTPCGSVQDPRQPLDDGQLWRESVNQLYENQMWVTFTSRLGQLLVPPWSHPPRITPWLTAERARHVGSHPGWASVSLSIQTHFIRFALSWQLPQQLPSSGPSVRL